MSGPIEEQSTEGGEALGSTAGNVKKENAKTIKRASTICSHTNHLMLSVAIEYERVFDRFEEEDYVYRLDLRKGDGREFEDDKKKGLRAFQSQRIRLMRGTKYITSNSYLECINCLSTVLKRCFLTDDNDLKSMSIEMMKKFDNMYGTKERNDDGNQVVTLYRNASKELFNDYKRIYSYQHLKNATSSSQVSHNQSSSSSVECLDTWVFGVFEDMIETTRKKNMDEIKRRKTVSSKTKETKTDLDRVLDSFRTSLTLQIVEALIYCQDWIRSSHVPINLEEKIKDLEKFEEEMRNISIESSAGDY
nr:hypothetical protein [Tanacetum cinerariifolium]